MELSPRIQMTGVITILLSFNHYYFMNRSPYAQKEERQLAGCRSFSA